MWAGHRRVRSARVSLQFTDGAFELVDRPGGAGGAEGFDEGAVVPERAVAAAGEAREDVDADDAQVREDGARVVELVAARGALRHAH